MTKGIGFEKVRGKKKEGKILLNLQIESKKESWLIRKSREKEKI